MTDSYIIKGGKPLKGEVILSGAKNVALKTIIAALMFKGNVILKNIPKINENFIINSGKGKNKDLLKLVRIIKEKVRQKFGVELEQEVIII